jgi:hypothetical protein
MEQDGSDWAARVVLPEWAGFQTRLGPYDAVSSPEPSDGTTRLQVVGSGTAPTEGQASAYRHLREHGEVIRDAILAAVFEQYPQFRDAYLDSYDEAEEDFPAIAAAVPPLDHSGQLRTLIGLGWVFVLDIEAAGAAYVGFEFGCEWDGHGLGVLTHLGRVIDIGQAPTAFDGRTAARDAETIRRSEG